MKQKLELIKEIYALEENDITQRREALKKLEPFVNEIMDRFYEKLLQKEEISAFIPFDRIEELKTKQIKFIADLLSKPFDEKLYNRIARVAIAHYHISLDPISMSYGYHILSELILAQSQKDPTLLPHLKLIIKYLKVAEAIMSQEYFAQKTLAKSPYRANDLFVAINHLHGAFMRCQNSFKKLKIDEEAKKEFEKTIDKLKNYRQILIEAGINLTLIKKFCTEFSSNPNEQTLKSLEQAIEKPLNELQISSYLSLISALGTMNAISEVIYSRKLSRDKNLTLSLIQKRIMRFLLENFGWAIKKVQFFEKEPTKEYTVTKLFSFKDNIFYLVVDLKNIQNRLFIQEAIDLLTEAMKLVLFVRSKEIK